MHMENGILITESTIKNWLKHWSSPWDEELYGITMKYIYIYRYHKGGKGHGVGSGSTIIQ